MHVGIAVGARRKVLAIFGDRRAVHRGDGIEPTFTEPAAFLTMPVRYDRAYGGRDEMTRRCPLRYARNPMGRGFVLRASREAMDGRALPNIEDPADLLTPQRCACSSRDVGSTSRCRPGWAGASATGTRAAR